MKLYKTTATQVSRAQSVAESVVRFLPILILQTKLLACQKMMQNSLFS